MIARDAEHEKSLRRAYRTILMFSVGGQFPIDEESLDMFPLDYGEFCVMGWIDRLKEEFKSYDFEPTNYWSDETRAKINTIRDNKDGTCVL